MVPISPRPTRSWLLLRPHLRFHTAITTAMSINMEFHAFAGSTIRSRPSKPVQHTPASALESLKQTLLSTSTNPPPECGKILLFKNGRPLVGCGGANGSVPVWGLEWLGVGEVRELLLMEGGVGVGERAFVYLGVDGEEGKGVLWGVDVSDCDGVGKVLGKRSMCFVELRTLMVATDWTDVSVLQQLAVAGQVNVDRRIIGMYWIVVLDIVIVTIVAFDACDV